MNSLRLFSPSSKLGSTLGNAIRILSIPAVLAMLAVGIFCYKADAAGLLIFLLFLIFWVQLPGLFIADCLKLKFRHISTALCISFFLGWAAIIAEYFIADLLKNNCFLLSFGPLMAFLYIIPRLKKRSDFLLCGQFKPNKISAALCLFAVLVLFYALLGTQYSYLNPDVAAFTYMNPDKAYHMGLINSLSHDYPLESIWVQGRIIRYHIFTEILYSVPVSLFRLNSDFILMSCGPYMTSYVVCLSIYSFFKEMSEHPERAGIYSLLLLLSNIYLTRSATSSLAFRFIIINENAAGFGVAAAMAVVIVLDKWWKERAKGSAGKTLIALVALVMLMTGIKGPVGAVIVAALWGSYILALIMKKADLRAALPLILITAGFALVYMTVLGAKGSSNGSGESIIAFATIANIAFWKPALIAFLKKLGMPKIIRLGIVLVVFMAFFLTAYFLPFVIAYIRELILVLSGRKKYELPKVVVYAAFLVGLIAMFVLNYSGHSQVYFGFVSVFFAPMIAYWYFEDLEAKGSQKLLRILGAIFLITIVATTASLGVYYIKHIGSAVKATNAEAEHSLYLSVSKSEYEAMEWIDDNTPEDSLLATDRYYSVAPEDYDYENRWKSRFFLYGVYANRFCYIAGSGYNLPADGWTIRKEMTETNNELYEVDNENRGDLARELGVDYVVVSKRFTDLPSLENKDYEICFDNEDVVIYEVIPAP